MQDIKASGRNKGAQTKKRLSKIKEAERQEHAKNIAEQVDLSNEITAKVILSMLYGSEGAKKDRDGRLTFVNSDPQMIRAFITLMRSVYTIDETKWRCTLHLHSYHREQTEKRFWSQLVDVPLQQFTKVYQKKNDGPRKRDGYRGCLSLRYYDSEVAKELYYLYKEILKGV